MPDSRKPFWETKDLKEMNREEWESLCDGCAKCCLVKLEDIETNELAFTSIACRLLNIKTCSCSDYQNRSQRVSDCLKLTPELASNANWLPSTCAYRLVAKGQKLKWWHPLVSGDKNAIHKAGISVQIRVTHESRRIDPEDHIVDWPK